MFCNRCGKQAESFNSYCGNCGGSINQESLPVQAVESNFNFCRSCGAAVQGRYCEACGESSVKVEAKIKNSFIRMDQIKQTGAAMKKALPSKEALKEVKLETLPIKMPTTEEVFKWVKQGAVLSVIVTIIGVLLSLLVGMGLKEFIVEETYGGFMGFNSVQEKMFNTVLNFKLFMYSILFGGKINWSVAMGGVKGNIAVTLPFIGLILSVLIVMISEKVRASITGMQRTLVGNGIMSVITGVVVTLGGVLLNKSVRTNMEELYGYGYGYGYSSSEQTIKLGTNINLLLTFFMAMIVTFFVLQIVMKNSDVDGKQNVLLGAIRKVIFTVTGCSFVIAASIVVKIINESGDMPEGAGWIAVLISVLYLTGVLLAVLLTGQFNILGAILNSDSVLKLKMTITSMTYEMYGMDDKVKNFMKWWLIIAVIITIAMVLVIAYQFFKDREMDVKMALKESALVSIGVGIGCALISKVASFTMAVNFKVTNSYYRDMLDVERGKYSFAITSGNTSFIKNVLIITVVMCVIFMAMYWLVNLKQPTVDAVMATLKTGVLWAAVGVFCICLIVKFDVYDVNYTMMDIIEDAGDYIADELEDKVFDMFDFF